MDISLPNFSCLSYLEDTYEEIYAANLSQDQPNNLPLDVEQTFWEQIQKSFQKEFSSNEQLTPQSETIFTPLEQVNESVVEDNLFFCSLIPEINISHNLDMSDESFLKILHEAKAIERAKVLKKQETTDNFQNFWSQEEDEKIIAYAIENGTSWQPLELAGRSKGAIKARFNKRIKPHLPINILEAVKKANSIKKQKLNHVLESKHWTKEEEHQLLELIEEMGFNWRGLAARLGRSEQAIEQHYHRTLKASLPLEKFANLLQAQENNSLNFKQSNKWTKEEKQKLQDLVKEYGTNWIFIGDMLDRNASSVKNTYRRIQKNLKKEASRELISQSDQTFTPLEQVGQSLSPNIEDRLDHSLLDSLAPEINMPNENLLKVLHEAEKIQRAKKREKTTPAFQNFWSQEEDEKIIAYAIENGTAWQSLELAGRTPVAIRDRFKKKIKKDLHPDTLEAVKKANFIKKQKLNHTVESRLWTREEEHQLLELIEKMGFNWKELAARLGRSEQAIEQHFYRKLKFYLPLEKLANLMKTKQSNSLNFKQSKWTKEEKQQLQDLVKEHGTNWVFIGNMLDRNASSVKNAYRRIQEKLVKEASKEQFKSTI